LHKLFSFKKSIATSLLILGAIATYAYAQDRRTWDGHFTFRQTSPEVRFAGTLNYQTLGGTAVGYVGPTYGGFRRYTATQGAGSLTVTAAQTGGTFINTATGTTTTFTLPAAATAGLSYCFVEGGDAAGELLLAMATGDNVVGKIHAAENGTGIATAVSTGIKNTAATNVKGDFVCLVSDGITTYYMTSLAGVWASR